MTNTINRICLCTFWEKDGIVRDYFSFYIKSLSEICSKVIIIVNGNITKEGKQKLKSIKNTEILEREDKGFDFGAWKAGLEHLGYDNLSPYHELILTNSSCYGPIYPFETIFNEMQTRECDFWGLTKRTTRNKTQKPEYIQTYFVVIKNKMFTSERFQKYFNTLKLAKTEAKERRKYETKFTKHFESLGFTSDCYLDVSTMRKNFINPTLYTDIILKERKFPLIKRKTLCSQKGYETVVTQRRFFCFSKNILNYIKRNTNYNLDLIYEDILANQPMSVIQDSLSLTYVLSAEYSKRTSTQNKFALILYIYYEDLIDYCLNYAKSMPEGSDFYIVSSKQSVLDKVREESALLPEYNFIYRLKRNRGRDVSAYLITCKDVFENYDLICCMHDKKSNHKTNTPIMGMDFQDYCFENNLKSKSYVENIISTFNKNKRIGLLCPPPFTTVFKNKIQNNSYWLQKLHKILNLNVPFDSDPNAPWGACFWIRGKAIQPLFRKNWNFEDFPQEPLPSDGTISHAIERIYPSIVQEAGYFAGMTMPENYASSLITTALYKHKIKQSEIFRDDLNTMQKFFSITNIQVGSEKCKQYCILGKKIVVD